MKLPWTLYRYVGREIYLNFFLSLAALSLLFMVVSGIRGVGDNFSLRIIMPWIFESLGYSLFFTVPLSLLFSSTIAYGRIVHDKEYTAVSASGMSPLHLFVPIGVLSVALTVIAFAVQGEVLPRAHYVKRNIARYLVKQLDNLGEGYERELPIDKGSVFCGYYNGSYLREVRIVKYLPRKPKDKGVDLIGDEIAPAPGGKSYPIQVLAKEAQVTVDDATDEVVLSLRDVRVLFENDRAEVLWERDGLEWPTAWDSLKASGMDVRFPIDSKKRRRADKSTDTLIEETRASSARVKELSARLNNTIDPQKRDALQFDIDNIETEQNKVAAEIWRRRAMALSFFSFAFLGFPVSLTLRHRHRLVGFFIGMSMVVLIYYPLLMASENLVRVGWVPAPIALLSGNIVLIATAAFLTVRLHSR